MQAFVQALRSGDPHFILSDGQTSLASHRLVFAAEAARRETKVRSL